MPDATTSQAILALCRCTPVEFILLIAALAILLGLRTWRRRDRTVQGRQLAVQLTATYVASVVAVGVGIWLHERGSSGLLERHPLGRAALVARANSICATELNFLAQNFDDLQAGRPGRDPQTAINQELKDIEAITPAASLRRDWRRVVAGLVARNHLPGALTLTAAQKAADSRAENKGIAAERRLGIHC